MKSRKIVSLTIALSLAIAVFTTPVAVFAQSATSTPSGSKLEQREANLQKRAVTEITSRIDSLNKIVATLNSIKKISDTDRAALLNQVQTEIQSLQALETKIQGDTDITTLRTDVQSITKAFRVYWLFLPKIHVLAAADRIDDVTSLMTNVANKLQARITAGGSQTSSLQTTLNDALSKIKDAQTQAQNAVSLVTALQPDNGDQNVLQSNVAALKSARTDIQTANQDIKTAYQDFKSIVQALKQLRETKETAEPASTP